MDDDTATPDGEHPLHLTVALDANSRCIATARRLAADFLARAGTGHHLPISQRATDVTQLVVSELVTNAIKHAPGPALMELRIDGDMIEVVVRDCGPMLPAARAPDAGRVGQHGLEIVRAVAYSFEARRTPAGKRIAARIALHDAPDGATAGQPPR